MLTTPFPLGVYNSIAKPVKQMRMSVKLDPKSVRLRLLLFDGNSMLKRVSSDLLHVVSWIRV